jgi:hypothetical protein
MAFTNHVGPQLVDAFGNKRIGNAPVVSLAATGNAVVQIPISGSEYILRRIVVSTPANSAGGSVPNMSTGNVTILTSSDGNTTNAVANAQTLTNVTAAHTWQDLTLATATATASYTSGSLYVLVGTAVANSTVQISVFGDVVTL